MPPEDLCLPSAPARGSVSYALNRRFWSLGIVDEYYARAYVKLLMQTAHALSGDGDAAGRYLLSGSATSVAGTPWPAAVSGC